MSVREAVEIEDETRKHGNRDPEFHLVRLMKIERLALVNERTYA